MHREDRSRSPGGDNSEMRSATCSVRIRLLAAGRITGKPETWISAMLWLAGVRNGD